MINRFIIVCLFLSPAALSLSDSFDHSHARYGRVLAAFVHNGLVDYASLKADRSELDLYLDETAGVTKSEFDGWTRNEQLAFLINVYNAKTLQLILDHYPVKSIKDIGGLKGPWEIPVVRHLGSTITLNHLEHAIIRKRYGEPRIHFALVCAAMGCPSLREEPYTAERLEAQLQEQGQRFLAAADKNSVDRAKKTVYLSPIFKWFASDFEGKAGSVLRYVEPFFSASELDENRYKIRYTEYDWSLNEFRR